MFFHLKQFVLICIKKCKKLHMKKHCGSENILMLLPWVSVVHKHKTFQHMASPHLALTQEELSTLIIVITI